MQQQPPSSFPSKPDSNVSSNQRNGISSTDWINTDTTILKERVMNSLYYYIGIEAAWHVALFAACYRYRPLVQLSKSDVGQRVITMIQKRLPKTTTTPSFIPPNITCQRTVVAAASEWFFFNKVVGIPLWPTKVLLAGWLNSKVEGDQKHPDGNILQRISNVQGRRRTERMTYDSTEDINDNNNSGK